MGVSISKIWNFDFQSFTQAIILVFQSKQIQSQRELFVVWQRKPLEYPIMYCGNTNSYLRWYSNILFKNIDSKRSKEIDFFLAEL